MKQLCGSGYLYQNIRLLSRYAIGTVSTASTRAPLWWVGEAVEPHDHKDMEGYAKAARLMAKYEEFAIFKRFKALNYQGLLYRQAEIAHLQKDLEELAERDSTDPSRQPYAKDWWALAHTETKKEGGEQWRKVQQIRKKLDDYSTRYGDSK